ncbi:MAG TPA: GNAT family N-acetyltransferase [Xanthomonadaceae bacterium]|nr:GNAT family N-acetyltransferase [Xanthomonadaceae bacterium]
MDRHVRIHPRIAEIPAASWDALRPDDNPFVSHAFLEGLERCGCLRPQWGWRPHHLALYEDERLVAAAPAYLKGNSHGEFVFDHAWAEAYRRHGLDYYPKLLCAVPYSPVTGPRLLVGPDRDGARRARLVEALRGQCQRTGVSGVHANFVDADDAAALAADGWLQRRDWQFHWRNRGYRDFADFLDALTSKKRRNIRQERRHAAAHGLEIRLVHGDQATAHELDAMHGFYAGTFADKGNLPVLSTAFFHHLAASCGRAMLLALAGRGDRLVAGALFLRSRHTLYGRYWGSEVDLPGLHFELCYYRAIEYAIAEGLQAIEPGAQGEHKLQRGFEPAMTCSYHYIAEPQFRAAIADWLQGERAWSQRYGETLLAHSPYRTQAT